MLHKFNGHIVIVTMDISFLFHGYIYENEQNIPYFLGAVALKNKQWSAIYFCYSN